LLIPFSVSPVYLFTCIPITVPSVYLYTCIPITVPSVYLFTGIPITVPIVYLLETGKGGVSGWSTRLEPAHMVKSLDKNRW
jgi:hypothetical protein